MASFAPGTSPEEMARVNEYFRQQGLGFGSPFGAGPTFSDSTDAPVGWRPQARTLEYDMRNDQSIPTFSDTTSGPGGNAAIANIYQQFQQAARPRLMGNNVGGFGNYPYPTRRAFGNNEPESQIVRSYNQSEFDDFSSDWQRRYNELAGTATSGSSASREYLPEFAYSEKTPEGTFMRGGPHMPTDETGRPVFQDGWMSQSFGASPADPSGMNRDMRYGNDAGGVFMQFGKDRPAYSPDFSPLNAEMAAKEAEFASASENQTRQQQAYNTMLAGNGQIGGVMTDAYSDPGFGQITGQAPGANASPPSFGGFGGDMTGVQDTTVTGQYMGGAGRYNPFTFSAFQNRNQRAGL